MMVSAIITSTIVLFACNKDDKDNIILIKNGLPFSWAQEAPARATSATGTADVTYNKSTKMLTYPGERSGHRSRSSRMHFIKS